jgi:hypothetical protein
MIKTIFIGVWACLIALAASQGATYWMRQRADRPASGEASAGFETRKTKEINIPIIRDGAVKGYVVTQLSYVVDLAVAKKLPVLPDPFVVDETFKYIYDDDKIDFAHLGRLELDKMTQALISRINTRIHADVIKNIGVLECNFLLNNEAKPKI